MKNVLYLCLLFAVFSCNKNEKKEVVIIENKVVKQSEMAALMLKMYDKGLENKKLVIEGKTPENFPEEFLNIHTAKLTDPSDRTKNFKTFSDFYLNSFKEIYNTSKDSLVINHNNAINSCIACHETTCVGPIPRIKKLLIK